ncbi:adhesion G protein-coupled receptor F5-like [Tachysurus vachellii]|uniref:adhesion G protein-coupled receptor F5-like n=1 Tax=Tachysurus vachellii TaxID=175792 RepID=UPI00296AEA0A|nr:adhesion G protein-coupled receptor F5-like [Tachysurus vachellii]
MSNKGKRSACFLGFVAILLIYMQVVNSQGLFEFSDMLLEFSNTDGYVRNKRAVSTEEIEYVIIIEVNVSQAIYLDQIKSSLDSIIPFRLDNTTDIVSFNVTTVCNLTGTEYQCRCEDQYSWPCEKCALYGSCNNVTNSSCGCINAFPNDGHFCQPINELTSMYNM